MRHANKQGGDGCDGGLVETPLLLSLYPLEELLASPAALFLDHLRVFLIKRLKYLPNHHGPTCVSI